MEITDVRIRKLSNEDKMKGIVSVTFDNEFVVHDIKIIDGINGLFIAMPSRKIGKSDYRDIAHPLSPETRTKIREAIFIEYEKVLSEHEALAAHDEVIETETPVEAEAEVIETETPVE
ncbi:MAG: septation regulator SpoVG [Peptostreptococcaceae bacterium]|nr:septation regulator SpoVG [Peptostreptococcaceae bacterium]